MIVKKIAVFCTGNIKAYNAFGTEQYEVFIKINEFKKYKFSGNCLEFGANHKMQRNFLNKYSIV